jgi:hypothetical protein
MKLYIYAQSGHAFGLEKVRKAAVISKKLDKYNPILATADYRAATYAKDNLDVKKGVGIDVLTNLPHMMNRGDFLIFDSNEASDFTKDHMKEFCSLLYQVGEDNLNSVIVDDIYKNQNRSDHKIEKLFYYGDDDYTNQLLNQAKDEDTLHDIPLLMGHYMFLGDEDKLKPFFNNIIDEEDYNDTIIEAKYLLTGSEQTALEAIANNANVVLLKRDDKQYIHLDLFKQCNIPIIDKSNLTLKEIFEKFNTISENYPQIKRDIFSQFDKDIEQILKDLSKFDKLIELTKHQILPQDMNV